MRAHRNGGEAFDPGRTCPECGVEFCALNSKRNICSEACQRARSGRRKRERIPRTVSTARVCPECGGEFTPTPNNAARAVLCSTRCQRRKYGRDYRARLVGAAVEDVFAHVVYERSRWICGLCGLRIRAGRPPDPLARASIDHVIPLSKGGAHSYANTQAAHRGCNSRKGARLALVA